MRTDTVPDFKLRTMNKAYRNGPVGALMDEYERAASELGNLLELLSDDDFERIVDSETEDDACRSVQTIVSHVINAAYGYADYIREQLSIESTRPQKESLSRLESVRRLDEAIEYTAETLKDRWEMSDEEISGVVINSGWGVVYDLEQMLEHAIVHILRHRRQIDKFIWQGKLKASAISNNV